MTEDSRQGEPPVDRRLPLEGTGPDSRDLDGLRIAIDRDLCVGFGDCLDVAPDAFALDAEGIAVLTRPGSVDRDVLLEACRACPVDAITVREGGEVLAP